jgi:hypothetical protein
LLVAGLLELARLATQSRPMMMPAMIAHGATLCPANAPTFAAVVVGWLQPAFQHVFHWAGVRIPWPLVQ